METVERVLGNLNTAQEGLFIDEHIYFITRELYQGLHHQFMIISMKSPFLARQLMGFGELFECPAERIASLICVS